MPQSRTADVLHYLTLLPLSFLALVVVISLLVIRTPLRAAPSHHTTRSPGLQTPPPPTTPATTTSTTPPSYPTAEQLKAQDDRFASALDVLKDRASSQQTLIATITTLTGLYVVILSFAAYFRLQQTRDESKEAVKANKEGFAEAKKYYDDRFKELTVEIRADIPALHGIGRRLEQLLAELDSRLPVDGDWTNATTYDRLAHRRQRAGPHRRDGHQLTRHLQRHPGHRRPPHRLPPLRSSRSVLFRARQLSQTHRRCGKEGRHSHRTVHPDDPSNSLCRGSLYLDKAVRIDENDPVALRARGVILMHIAIWKRETAGSPDYDRTILAHSKSFIDRSLKNNPAEPGALFARAWLLVRATPPEYEAAIKDLTMIIDHAAELSTLHRRKFLDICYLNRANYTARVLRQSTPTLDQKKVALESITKDLQEGMKVAEPAGKKGSYVDEIRREIGKDGDLELVYPEIKSTVDPLLTT